MTSWNEELYARLITGSVPRVIFSGGGIERPELPFVMVKTLFSADRKIFQIYVYNIMGTQSMMEAYLLRELPGLFKEPLVSPAGGRTTVRETAGIGGPNPIADAALSMSRDFWIPLVY
jgi:hypothetical protein